MCVPNECRKSNGCYCKLARLWRTAVAVPAYTQGTLEDAPRLLILSQKVHTYGHVFHDTDGRNPGQTLKILLYFSNEIEMDTPLAGLFWERQLEEVLVEVGWEKSTKLRMSVFSSKTRIILIGKKQILASMWKKSMKNVDLDEPTSFLDHVHLGCPQHECKPNEINIQEYTKC